MITWDCKGQNLKPRQSQAEYVTRYPETGPHRWGIVKCGGEATMVEAKVHATAEIHPSAALGAGTVVWAWSQVRENAKIGSETSIGQGCYVGPHVQVGSRCRIQNSALIYEPAILGDGVFVGPGVILTNDRFPRAVNLDGSSKTAGDWDPVGVSIGEGASIGAGAVLIGPVKIGEWATIGAGAIVSRDVSPFALVVGNPAKQLGWVGRSGARLIKNNEFWVCPQSGDLYSEENGFLGLLHSGSVKGE